MAYVSKTYETFKDQVVSDATGGYTGECVSYVKQCCTGLGGTSTWKKGIKAHGATTLDKGTAIATFTSEGKYSGHAAIYVGQSTDSLQVWDQWTKKTKGKPDLPRPVSPRPISFRGGKGLHPVDDGDQYFVID